MFNTLIGVSAYAFFRAFRRAAEARGIDQPRVFPIASCSLAEPELVEIGPEACAGHVSSSVYFESIQTAANIAFVASYERRFPNAGPTSADAEASYLAVHLLARAVRRARSADPFAVRAALPHIAIEAPQGEVHVDRDNRHCYLTPRIGVSNAAGRFDIIYEAARPVRPDPYLVWQELKSPSGMRSTQPEVGQVTRHLVQNFRGVHALVIHGQDRNRAVLTETLTKLGLKVRVADPSDAPTIRGALNEAEIIVFDTDMAEAVALAWAGERVAVPVIAIVGLEAPGRLQRAFELEPAAVLYKPLRSTGIYSALFFATNEQRRRHELALKMQLLEGRHRSRRFVTRAIIDLMRDRGIDDEEAFRLLRKESMRRRLTIEEYAVQLAAESREAVKRAREA